MGVNLSAMLYSSLRTARAVPGHCPFNLLTLRKILSVLGLVVVVLFGKRFFITLRLFIFEAPSPDNVNHLPHFTALAAVAG
jgi:hypothetical protein